MPSRTRTPFGLLKSSSRNPRAAWAIANPASACPDSPRRFSLKGFPVGYCSRQDIENRLSRAGLLWLVDDDLDGKANETEKAAAIDVAIAQAGTEIDAALAPIFDSVPLPDAGENEWLKYKALDLAVEWLANRRGKNAPDQVVKAADRARAILERVRLMQYRVPGLVYPTDQVAETDRQRLGRPRVTNPRPPRKVRR